MATLNAASGGNADMIRRPLMSRKYINMYFLSMLLLAGSQGHATLPPPARPPSAEIQHIEITPCEQGAEGWATSIPIRNRRTGQYEYRTVLFSERILEPD